MTDRSEHPLLQRLEIVQIALGDAEPERADEIARTAIDVYSTELPKICDTRDVIIHSLSSFILMVEEGTDNLTKTIFPELIFVGSLDCLEYCRTYSDDGRILALKIDAEAISRPPVFQNDFEPFYSQISIPVTAVESIWPAA